MRLLVAVALIALLVVLGQLPRGAAQPADNRPAPAQLAQIALSSTKCAECAAFYRDVVGAEIAAEQWGPEITVYRGRCAGFALLIVPASITGVEAKANRHQLGFVVADLRKARAAGLAAGGSVDAGWEVQTQRDGSLSCAIRDPDGNSIELFQRP